MGTELAPRKPLPWFGKAAMLMVDMRRGLYPWPGKPPMNGDGSYRVVKNQILKDCNISPTRSKQRVDIWENPEFLRLVKQEEDRRDHAMQDVVGEIEAIKGPLMLMGDKIIAKVADIFEREPDDDDPTALSPAQYVKLGREWFHEALEVEGKLGSAKQNGIEQVLATLAQNNQVSSTMVDQALSLVREHRALQDRKMAHAGVMYEATAEEEE